MAAQTTTFAKTNTEEKFLSQDDSVEGVILGADYAEDRPVVLLAERQREFQKSLLAQGAIPFIPDGRSGPAPHPIPVRGEPVSEILIAERR